MKILLIGEYSRLHNSLKEGLIKNGHDVTLIGSGDQFKKYPVDINIESTLFNSFILKKFKNLIYRITKFDIRDLEIAYKFKKNLKRLKSFDVVQLINEDALFISPKIQITLLKQLFNQNKKIFLLCCGDDYTTINHYLKTPHKYSILTPYINNSKLQKSFKYSLKYTSKPYKKLHDFIMKNSQGVISTDFDYHSTFFNRKNYLGIIPNPINIDTLKYTPSIVCNKIIIFHGINRHNYIKKGNIFFENALKIIKQKYASKIEIITVENLAYKDYIKSYNKAHIILDQVYSHDQGYNALEAMAKGKVVFTGAEQEWLKYYNLKPNTIAINALPDAKKIAKKLEWLILNPEKIIEISKNARTFIEKEHNYIKIAKKYTVTWIKN